MFDKGIQYTYNYNDVEMEKLQILAEKGCGFMESGPSQRWKNKILEDSLSAFEFFSVGNKAGLTL